MTQHGKKAKKFLDTLDPEFSDGKHSLYHLENYLRDTTGKTREQQDLLNRAFGVYLAYYEVREQLDAALREIIAHECYHEKDT